MKTTGLMEVISHVLLINIPNNYNTVAGFSEEIYKDEYFNCFRLHARQGVS